MTLIVECKVRQREVRTSLVDGDTVITPIENVDNFFRMSNVISTEFRSTCNYHL